MVKYIRVVNIELGFIFHFVFIFTSLLFKVRRHIIYLMYINLMVYIWSLGQARYSSNIDHL